LNPAATPLQWLSTLQAVTDESIRRLKYNRKVVEQNRSVAESFLNVRVTKGYSCEPEEYHNFIANVALISANYSTNADDNTSLTPQLNNACLVIESEQACRRCKLRKDGNIEAGIDMNIDEIRQALHNYAAKSNEYKDDEKEELPTNIYSQSLNQTKEKITNKFNRGWYMNMVCKVFKRLGH
jgi:hypothetical protein